MARILSFVLVIASCASAHAQDDAQARARAHYESAQAAVAAEHYDEAYAEFSAGYELSARATFLFNMAECALQAGRRDRAREDYQRYLERAPSGSMAETARRRLIEIGVAPRVTPPVPTPAQTAARVLRPRRDLPAAPVVPAREIWEEEAFWIIGGVILALVIGGAITGGVLASNASGPACGPGCVLADFR